MATSSNNLHAASSEWANRPADQRYWTLTEMARACREVQTQSKEIHVPFSGYEFVAASNGAIVLGNAKNKSTARLTHHAFDQVSGLVKAPASYLRTLPAPLAVQALNYGLERMPSRDEARELLLFGTGAQRTVRAITSTKYDRVWDADLCDRLETLGMRPPAGRHNGDSKVPSRPATKDDILPGQINVSPGDLICPSGLYASDHDMFAFLIAPDRTVGDGPLPLMRGVFIRNSEVGDASLSVTMFLCQAVCGNHIVWNATGVSEIRVRHVGRDTLHRALGSREFKIQLARFRDAADYESGVIQKARETTIAASKTDVIEAVLKFVRSKNLPLSKPKLEAAYDVTEKHTDWYGAPNTVWGMVSGLTHASQGAFEDEREVTDRAAGKLLAMVN